MSELRWEQGCCYYWTQVTLFRRTWDMVYWFTTTTGSVTISSLALVVVLVFVPLSLAPKGCCVKYLVKMLAKY